MDDSDVPSVQVQAWSISDVPLLRMIFMLPQNHPVREFGMK